MAFSRSFKVEFGIFSLSQKTGELDLWTFDYLALTFEMLIKPLKGYLRHEDARTTFDRGEVDGSERVLLVRRLIYDLDHSVFVMIVAQRVELNLLMVVVLQISFDSVN